MGQSDNWDYLTEFIKKYPDTFADELSKPPYCVKTIRHPERSNLVMFKYSQFESDFTNEIVRCCRGPVYLINDDKTTNSASASPAALTARPYLMPFFKFMNYGENGADKINWNRTLYVRDKLDGSLIKLLKEDDSRDLWTTNGSFDINAEVPEIIPAQNDENLLRPYTFVKLRDYALGGREEEIKNLPSGWTFMFELVSPYNRIIVPYRETKLYLLGCRDPQGNERTPEWAVKNFNLTFDTPKIFIFKNIDEIIEYCKNYNSIDQEGFVVQDENFNRIKLKTDHYRSLFYLKGEDHFSDSRIFDSIRQGTIDDAAAAWPEIIKRTEEIKNEWISFINAVKKLCETGTSYFQECNTKYDNPREAKKRYAMFVMENHKPFSSFMFETVKENPELESIFNKITYKELINSWIPALET